MSSKIVLSKGSAEGWPQTVVICTDGASRGNPGPASFGLVVVDSKEEKILKKRKLWEQPLTILLNIKAFTVL